MAGCVIEERHPRSIHLGKSSWSRMHHNRAHPDLTEDRDEPVVGPLQGGLHHEFKPCRPETGISVCHGKSVEGRGVQPRRLLAPQPLEGRRELQDRVKRWARFLQPLVHLWQLIPRRHDPRVERHRPVFGETGKGEDRGPDPLPSRKSRKDSMRATGGHYREGQAREHQEAGWNTSLSEPGQAGEK